MISLVSLQHPIICNKGQSVMLPGNKREASCPAGLECNVKVLGLLKKSVNSWFTMKSSKFQLMLLDIIFSQCK